MVQFVDAQNMARWISTSGVEHVIDELTGYLEEDFKRWPSFSKIARVTSQSDIGVIELMPTSDGTDYAFKYVAGHPSNPTTGMQTVAAFGVLADATTGYPTFWSEMTLLTALRTAATSAMAARVLARPDSATLALIGTGSQSEFQALAMRSALDVSMLRIWDIDDDAMAKFVRNVEPLGFDVHIASSAADAADGADVVTTCTAEQAHAVVVPTEAIAPGTHVNAIGGDSHGKTELDPSVLYRSDVFVEFVDQTRLEGEIQQVESGFPVTELWEVIAGHAPGRRDDRQITVFDSVGFAIEDYSALRYVRDAVAGTDFFELVELIVEPSHPKNLFDVVVGAFASVH